MQDICKTEPEAWPGGQVHDSACFAYIMIVVPVAEYLASTLYHQEQLANSCSCVP